MSKNTTKYTVLVNDEAQEKTFSKKALAVETARQLRKEQNAAVRVETQAGNVVFEQAAPKKIKMSPRYTRVVNLPADAKIPDGMRVAYTRNRKNLAITHDFDAPEGPYNVVNFLTGEVLATEIQTTRDAGAFCKTVPAPVKEKADA